MNILLLIQGSNLGIRFLITLFFVSLLILLATSKKGGLRENTYTYFVISVMVFFLCFTLNTLDLNLGMALGLFAIFGIIRYRTETIRTEDMTYLFAFIGLAVINALTPFNNLIELILINLIISGCIALAQKILLFRRVEEDPMALSQKTTMVVPIGEDLKSIEHEVKSRFEQHYKKPILRIELNRVDDLRQQITFTIYH
ncbi:DUF4956 domain-containing protein [Robiginitalea sp.]|jgi:hypothetical protein|nr:DUF4956 domain-containing protein [Robiginitalea sp.]